MKNKLFLFFALFAFSCEIFSHSDETDLIFIENKGQWDQNVKFKADIKGGAIFLESNKISVNIRSSEFLHFENHLEEKRLKGHSYQIQFLNSNLNPSVQTSEMTQEYFNYFIGNDPSKWTSDCKGYGEIIYKNIYDSIDLRIESRNFQPKYTFILRKGANPNDIKLNFVGLDKIEIDKQGNLISYTSLGEIKDEKPISYIVSEGGYRNVTSEYLLDGNEVSFKLGTYQLALGEKLEIDPQIIFSTYSGSTADNFGASATFDNFGNTYGTGLVFGTGYVTTTGAYDLTFNGTAGVSDIGVTKFNKDGSSRIYSTYIGGTSYDVPHSLVVDANNRLILLATTSSSNYPITTGSYQTSFAGGTALTNNTLISGLGVQYPNGADIAVTKFNVNGTALLGSTYYGGNGLDGIGSTNDLARNYGDVIRGEVEVDTFGNIYIASLTTSTNLTTLTNSYQKTNGGGYDGLLLKFNTNLTSLLGMTYIGGSGNDAKYDMNFNSKGNIVVAGGTTSPNLPTTTGAVNSSYGGNTDGFVSEFSNNFSTLNALSYYGTADYDQTYFVDLDRQDNVYLFGQTSHSATNYFIFNATFSNPHKGQFISKLNGQLSSKIASTTFGARNNAPDISPTAFLVDYCDKIFLTGWGSNVGTTQAFNLSIDSLPITTDAFQSTTLGNGFYMMILEGDLSALYYGTYFGGTTAQSREHVDGGTSRFDKNGIVYQAVCAGCGAQQNFPIYPSTTAVAGGTNNSSNCNLGVFKFDFGLPVTADFASSSVCAPGDVEFTNLSHKVSDTSKFFWTFSNGDTSTKENPTINFQTAGTYSATLIILDSGSCNIADTITKSVIVLGVNVDSLPDKVICPNSSVRIGYPNLIDPTLTVRWTPSGTLDDTTILAPFASPLVNTTYTVYLSKDGCTDTIQQTVLIEQPKALEIISDTAICGLTDIDVVATKYNQGSYDWYPKNLLDTSFRDSAVYDFVSFPVIVDLVYTSENGCQTSISQIFNQLNLEFNLEYDSVVCKGDVLKIETDVNVNGGTYTYIPQSKVTFSDDDSVLVLVDTAMSFTISYYVSPSCNAQDSINIYLIDDFINLEVDSILCFGRLINASVDSISNYNIVWSPTNILTSGQGTANAVYNSNDKDTVVTVTLSHNTRTWCAVSDSQNVFFLENNLELKADTLVCKGELVEVSFDNMGPVNKTFTTNNPIQSTTDSSAFITMNESDTVFVTVTLANGCSHSDTIFIRIVDDLVETTTDSIVCTVDTFNLATTDMVGATYLWLPEPIIIGNNTASSAKGKIAKPEWYYVHIQDTNGCYIIDSVFVTTYDSTFVVRADFVSNTNCNSNLVEFENLSSFVSPSADYFWDFDGEGTSVLENPSFSFSSGGMKNVRLITIDTATCNRRDTVNKFIYVLQNGTDTLPTIKECTLTDSVHIGMNSMKDSVMSKIWVPTISIIDYDSLYPKVPVTSTIQYTLYLSKNGCTDTLTQWIVVDTPRIMNLTGDSVACTNQIIPFKATQYDSGQYNWFPFSNVAYQDRDTANLLVDIDQFKVLVEYISEYNCRSYDSIIVDLRPTALSLTSDSIVCDAELIDIKLSYTPPSGSITFLPASQISQLSDTLYQYSVDTSRVFLVEYKINNLCIDVDTLDFKLLEDKLNWEIDTIACLGGDVDAMCNISPEYSVQWAPNSLLKSTQGQTPVTFGDFTNPNDVSIYSFINARPTCDFSDTATVRVFEQLVDLKTDTILCRGDIVEVNVLPAGSRIVDYGPRSLLLNVGQDVVRFRFDTSRHYYVTLEDNSGCSKQDSVYVQLFNDLLVLSADSIVCSNDPVNVKASHIDGATYLWSNGITDSTFTETISQSTTYLLTVNGICEIVDSVTVLTLDTNTFKILTPDSLLCRLDTAIIVASRLPEITYNWSTNATILDGQGTNRIEAWIEYIDTFYVTASLPGKNCDVVDVIVLEKDTQYLKLTAPSVRCLFDTVTVTANFNANFSYDWDQQYLVSTNNNIANYYLQDSSYFHCEATSTLSTKCKYIDSVFVDYSRGVMDLVIEADPSSIEYNQSSQLTTTVSNAVRYEWSPPLYLSNSNVPNPSADSVKSSVTYYLTVTDPVGCKSSDSISIGMFYEACLEPEVYLPNAFSPNGDGKNDELYVRGDNIILTHLVVYDRWGQLVFETRSKKIGWDGTFKGEKLEPGVFAYHLYVECIGGETYSNKGNITLLK